MTSVEVDRYRKQLDHLFGRAVSLSSDMELQAHWAKYLCVLVSGFIETSIRSIYGAYAKTRADQKVSRYVDHKLDSFQNPKMQRILDLTAQFSPDWERNLKNATEGEIKDAVDSIVANKNMIAHGESVGITYSRVESYYKNVLKVVELIDKQCSH